MIEHLPVNLHMMGEHWLDDLSAFTQLGQMVTRAKDGDVPEASEALCRLIGEFAISRPRLSGHPSQAGNACVVAAVPPNPTTEDHLATRLAEAVAEALNQPLDLELITRQHHTTRLRDTEPSERRELASRAGYKVTRPLEGASIVLVDDVIMTGTTIGFIAELLVEAGAGSIDVVVASRTARRSG